MSWIWEFLFPILPLLTFSYSFSPLLTSSKSSRYLTYYVFIHFHNIPVSIFHSSDKSETNAERQSSRNRSYENYKHKPPFDFSVEMHQNNNAKSYSDSCSTTAASFLSEIPDDEDPRSSHSVRVPSFTLAFLCLIRIEETESDTGHEEICGTEHRSTNSGSGTVPVCHQWSRRYLLKKVIFLLVNPNCHGLSVNRLWQCFDDLERNKSQEIFRMNYQQLRMLESSERALDKFQVAISFDSSWMF